jgi:biopolymer transport protein ExbD
MRFPRNVKIFRGQLDAAPFAGVIFLIVILLLLHTKLAYTPGVRIDLPEVQYPLAGTPNPTIIVALDAAGNLYYENQQIGDEELFRRLKSQVKNSKVPLTLEVHADRSGTRETMLRVQSLAFSAGFDDVLWATRPQLAPVTPEKNE